MANEDIKEKRRKHYQENKEKILAYQKKYVSSFTKEQKEARRAYYRAYYAKKKAAEGKPYNQRKKDNEPKPPKKQPVKVKGFELPKDIKLRKYPNDILVLSTEIRLDYIPDDNMLSSAKRELTKHLLDIKRDERIVIVEGWNKLVTIEVYLKNEDCMQLIINELDDFLKNISRKPCK